MRLISQPKRKFMFILEHKQINTSLDEHTMTTKHIN